jgi:nucleoid-associated protein YgaU
MIFQGSRYEKDNLYVDTENDKIYLAQVSTEFAKSSQDLVYRVKAGDRLDLLANRFYGNPQKQWVILYANPEYSNETEITEGSVLTIPNPKGVI